MPCRPITLTTAFILLTAFAGPAAARTPPQDGAAAGMPGMPRTAEEVRPWAERLFTRLDANQDGAITEEELAVLDNPTAGAMGGPRLGAMIFRSDADGDGRVGVEELVAGARRMFERMDRGGVAGGMGPGMGAGMLDLPRTADAVAPWAERVFARLDANQDGVITGDELAVLASPTVAAMGGSRLRAMIVQSDSNRDSRISAEEFAAGAQRAFDRMDRNGDGRLSDDELPRPPTPPPAINIPMPEPDMPFPDMPNGD